MDALPPKNIGVFHLDDTEITTMKYGFYYEASMKLPFAEQPRHVRVWLPPSYDFHSPKRYPVLYMADGQNLVNYYLSPYGDWHLDRVIHDLSEQGVPEPILVGIDCPHDPAQRARELNPPYPVRATVERREMLIHPYGNLFVDYIAKELKPLIDSLFSTDPSPKATGIGGASMGGIMAFYAIAIQPKVFGFSLSFSTPFFFYTRAKLRQILDDLRIEHNKTGKIYLYVGGSDFERRFTRKVMFVKNQLLARGFKPEHLAFCYDAPAIHNEEAWCKHSYDALRFWLKPESR